jgi:heptosyltransferase II
VRAIDSYAMAPLAFVAAFQCTHLARPQKQVPAPTPRAYAVRAGDVAEAKSKLQAIDENPAGAPTSRRPPPIALTGIAGRVLVKEVNWLGDLVISLPALRAVRAAFALSTLSVMVRAELAGFFDGMSWIEEVIPYTVRRGVHGIGDRLVAIRKIRARSFDLAILFPNSFESALWTTIAGVPRRAGFIADHRRAMLTHRSTPTADALNGHQSEYWLAMIGATLGIRPAPGFDAVKLEVAERHVHAMRAWLAANRMNPDAPLIAIAPAAAYGPAKEWPLVRYAALIDLLSERAGAECVLVGAPAEQSACAQVAATSRAGAIVAAGQTAIGELMAVLSLCDGFAGNDSGAMHLAAALALPAVGIFGSTNPQRTGPIGPRASYVYHKLECSPCLARTCRFGHYNCLREITPGEVALQLAALGAFDKKRK